jgi:hypothetical protein
MIFLGVNKIILLGYMVSKKGREPGLKKIAVMDGLATPTNVRGIAKLLGHVGWYRNFSKTAVSITQLLRKNCTIEWTKTCQRAFKELRDKLNTYPVLRPPDWDKYFHVFYDASNVAVGNQFCQLTGEKGKDQLIAYASKQLTPAERNYSTIERECLPMVSQSRNSDIT